MINKKLRSSFYSSLSPLFILNVYLIALSRSEQALVETKRALIPSWQGGSRHCIPSLPILLFPEPIQLTGARREEMLVNVSFQPQRSCHKRETEQESS